MKKIGDDEQYIAVYNKEGNLVSTARSVRVLVTKEFLDGGIRAALKSGKIYKGYFYRYFSSTEIPLKNIEVPYLCIIDGIMFMKQIEVAEYCGVTKQAVSSAKAHGAVLINGKSVKWAEK